MFRLNEILEASAGKLISGSPNIQINNISTDTRTLKRGDLFIAIKGQRFDGHAFIPEAIKKGAKAIIFSSFATNSPKKDTALIKVRDTLEAFGRIAAFHRKKFSLPVICLTGSNGKTTAKEMSAWVLSSKFSVHKNEGTKNNIIGLAQTLLGLKERHQICVLEIGTNHFGEIENLTKIAQPNIGVITNIGPAHLEFFKNLSGVFGEKIQLFSGLLKPRIGILNADDKFLNTYKRNSPLENIFSFGIKEKAEFRASSIKLNSQCLEFTVNKQKNFFLNTSGYHNVYNALIAISLARIFGLEYSVIKKRLREFEFPAGRLKLFSKQDITFIDDSYNSNPLSLACALKAFSLYKAKGRKIFVMADMLELGKAAVPFHRQAAAAIKDVCDCFISVGPLAQITAETLKKKKGKNNVFICASPEEAKDTLFNKVFANKHDLILLKGSRRMMLEKIIE